MNPSASETTHQVESGTSISFPLVELHGIELLQVTILGLNVKCERCRTINEVTGLKPNEEKASSCKKCATAFTVKFRPEMVHQNSVRAGFIDVVGCTVVEETVPSCLLVADARHQVLVLYLSEGKSPPMSVENASEFIRVALVKRFTDANLPRLVASSLSRFQRSSSWPSHMVERCLHPRGPNDVKRNSVSTPASRYRIEVLVLTTNARTDGSDSRAVARYIHVTSATTLPRIISTNGQTE